MSTTTSILNANPAAFSHLSSTLSPRGTRIYSAVTWLQSDTPNGRYEIEQITPSMYVVTHHQVIARGETKIVRRVSGVAAKTKRAAIEAAERDSKELAANVLHALLNTKAHLFMPTTETEVVEHPDVTARKTAWAKVHGHNMIIRGE